MKQIAVPSPDTFSSSELAFVRPRVLELTYTAEDMRPLAEDLGYDGPPFPWVPDRRALLKAELDAYYAYLYQLSRDELRYILDPADVYGPDYPSETFRVLKEKETREFGEYRTRRLVLEAYDRFAADGTFDPAPRYRAAIEQRDTARRTIDLPHLPRRDRDGRNSRSAKPSASSLCCATRPAPPKPTSTPTAISPEKDSSPVTTSPACRYGRSYRGATRLTRSTVRASSDWASSDPATSSITRGASIASSRAFCRRRASSRA